MNTPELPDDDLIVPDTELERAYKGLARVERLLNEAGDPMIKLYYSLCARGWRRNIAKLEAERHARTVQ